MNKKIGFIVLILLVSFSLLSCDANIKDNGDSKYVIPHNLQQQGLSQTNYEAMLNLYSEEYGEDVEDLEIQHYLGEYNKAIVVLVLFYCLCPADTEYDPAETIGGLYFNFKCGENILVYYENELVALNKAYEKSFLTLEDLEAIHKAYKEKNK